MIDYIVICKKDERWGWSLRFDEDPNEYSNLPEHTFETHWEAWFSALVFAEHQI